MSSELAKQENVVTLQSFATREQVELVKKTCCPQDTTDDELKLFLHVARTSGLDPLRRQIYCTKRNGKLTIIAGIDGLRARAAREADYEGILHGVVCAKDVVEFEASTGTVTKHTYNPFADRGPTIGAWATVKRKGKLPFTANVKFSEFLQPQSPTWRQMPSIMIDKVAQSTALRMAYPEQFSAIYEQAEMDQAEPMATVNGAATAELKAKLAKMTAKVEEVRQEEVRPEPEEAQYDETPPPTDADFSQAPPPEVGEVYIVPIGLSKGKPISEVKTSGLVWLEKAARENLANPAKAKYRESDQAMLDAVLAENGARGVSD